MPDSVADWYPVPISVFADTSGSLAVLECGSGIPFAVKRIYWLFGMPDRQTTRGDHAHEELQQVLFCAKGRCVIDLETRGGTQESFELREGGPGLFLNGPVWRTLRDFSPDAAFIALCDRDYAQDTVLRDKAQWRGA